MRRIIDRSCLAFDRARGQARWKWLGTAILLTAAVGCSETTSSPEAATSADASQDWAQVTPAPETTTPPEGANRSTAYSDPNLELASASRMDDKRLVKGSPEWLLMEIAHLRNTPENVSRQPVPGHPGEYEYVELPAEQVTQEQIHRYEKIIELAMQAISKTHESPADEKLFNSAVHYLADARLHLALEGHLDQAQLLDENAEALFARDATSFAAIEAGSHVLQLTRTMADRHAAEDPQWAVAFANQARLFAERFPQETSRAAVNVIAAGRMCEQLQLAEEARACYAVVEQTFPNSPYAAQIEGSLRRLRLPGNQLTEFGGSTFDGGFVSISQLRGKPLLIAFWASNSEEFQADLPAIQSLVKESREQLHVIGVNMDRDERAVAQFLQQNQLPWKHIFYSDPEKRGAQNVVAHYYGVINVPQYWLVDAEGIVRSVDLDRTQLKEAVRTALQNH